jgi:hypothetical protein
MLPTGRTSRGIHGHPAHKRAKVVVPAFLLAAVFIFTGAPSATAAAMFANSHTMASWEPPPCRGDKPGVCPYYYLNYLDRQSATQSDTGEIGGNTDYRQQ